MSSTQNTRRFYQMGKYMRKAKAASDLAVMEVPTSVDEGGVRTRSATAAAAVESGKGSVEASYLQLRCRLLIRRPQGRVARCVEARRRRRKKGERGGEDEGEREGKKAEEAEGCADPGGAGRVGTAESGEDSCGDNALQLEGRDRSTRETTPCSLMKDPDGVRTPGSTTKPSNLNQTNRRLSSADCRNIPSTNEMDDFLASAEEEQQKSFIDKYNFDPVNEKPLSGRFEWEKLDP